MDIEEYIKKIEKQYRENNPPDFITHLHYIEFLNTISKDMSLERKREFNGKIQTPSKLLKQKARLINFTLKSIGDEYGVISTNNDFAVFCCSWIPVKSYYIVFNLLLILKYLITCDEKSFSSSHSGINKEFKGYIERGEIKFSKDCFNEVYDGKKIEEICHWKSASGESLKIISFNEEGRLKLILKKIVEYKKDDFKRIKNLKSLRGKNGKEFLSQSKINLSDFFYCWRIKANYGGMEFLDKQIPDIQFKNYFLNYYGFLLNYHKCLKNIINELAIIRFGEKVL